MTQRIDRYEIKRLLAEGATGRVYLARDVKLSREVAVKVLASDADEEVRKRFRLEAHAIAALKHPNIIGLHDFSGEESKQLFLVMEYVAGRSLYAMTDQYGTMSEPTALCVGHELALAIEHAHSHGVVHRDIKPENVLLFDGRIVLTDFGGVKVFAQGRGRGQSRTATLGTPGFMAPEQFAGKDIGPYTDVFSLGATLYNLTTGRIAYEGGSVHATIKNLKSGRYVDPRNHHQLLSPELATLLAQCLAPKPNDRFPNAARLRGRIREILALHGVEEIREELQRYEKSPAKYVLAQRDRAVDVLLKELTEALRNRDFKRANTLAERVQALAPLDSRAQKLAGNGAAVMRPQPAAMGGTSFWYGMAVGGALGVAGTMIVHALLSG